MANPPSQSLTLFSEKGTVKSISRNKLILDSERGTSIEIYVPRKIPCASNDHVEMTFEIAAHGFFGRQVRISRTGQVWPILPPDFLVLSEYLRFGFISLIAMIGFIVIGSIFPIYFLSIIFPVFLGILACYYWVGAFVVGKGMPNYNRATISQFAGITPEKYPQFFVKGSRPPLFAMEGTLKIVQRTPFRGVLLSGGREFPLIFPLNPQLIKYNNIEGNWIISFLKDQINVLGRIEREGNISWELSTLLSMGLLCEVTGYIIFFCSIVPGFLLYGLGTPVPFPGEILTSLIIACLFVGSCLFIVGKIVNLKKKRIQDNILVDYKPGNAK
jgi:hypothetical protein